MHGLKWPINSARIVQDEGERVLRFASVGGGPGYELYAAEKFFERFAPSLAVDCISLDLEPSWQQYVERLVGTAEPDKRIGARI